MTPLALPRMAMLLGAGAFAAALAAGCGGGGVGGSSGGHLLPPGSAQASIRLVLTNSGAIANARLRHVLAFGDNAKGISISVVPQGNPTAAPLVTAVDISPTSMLCAPPSPIPTPSAPPTPPLPTPAPERVCTLSVAAPAGADIFTIRIYDATPVPGGSPFPAQAKQLAAGIGTATITLGASNPSVNLALGGVTSSLSLTLAPPIMHVVEPTYGVMALVALDADGDIILGPYVDADGNSVTITASAPPNLQIALPVPSGLPSFAPSVALTASQSQGLPLYYNGQASNTTASESIAATGPGVAPGAATLNFIDPVVTLFAVPASFALTNGNVIANGIVGPARPGGGGFLVFTESGSAPGILGEVTPTVPAPTFTSFPCLTTCSGPLLNLTGSISGGGGILYATQGGSTPVEASVNAMGASFASAPPGLLVGGVGDHGILLDPASGIVYGDMSAPSPSPDSFLAYNPATPTSPPTILPISGSFNQVGGLAFSGATPGPSAAPAHVWFADGADGVGEYVPGSGLLSGPFAIVPSTAAAPDQLAAPRALGTLIWFTDYTNGVVGYVDTSTASGGSIQGHAFALPSGTAAKPTGITIGPDGAAWFTEQGNHAIGRIDPNTFFIREIFFGSGGEKPDAIAVGPDGNLWFVDASGSIGRLSF